MTPRRTWPVALCIFVVTLLVYNANCRLLGTGDTQAAPFVTLSLLAEGDFDLDEYEWAKETNVVVWTGRHYVSKYPVLSPLLAAPVFAVHMALDPGSGDPARNVRRVYLLSKFVATCFVAASALFVFGLLRAYGARWAAAWAFIYAFGTGAWPVSQAMWQHPASMMFLACGVWCLVRYGTVCSRQFGGAELLSSFAMRNCRTRESSGGGRNPKSTRLRLRYGDYGYVWLAAAGASIGAAVAARYVNVAIAVVLSVYVICAHRRHAWAFFAGALPFALFLACYNAAYFGSPFSQGYGAETFGGWSGSWGQGLAGILFSPSRGLFPTMPVLLFAPLGVWRALRHPTRQPLLATVAVGCVAFVLAMGKWWCWHGGVCYGCRMLTDIAPFLILFAALSVRGVRRWRWVGTAVGVLVALSVAIQAVGVLSFDHEWHRWAEEQFGEPRMYWVAADGQVAYYARRGRWYFFGPGRRYRLSPEALEDLVRE